MHRVLIAFLATLTIAAAGPTIPESGTIDQGSFKIFLHDRALGAETFEILLGQDSLVVHAQQYLILPGDQGDDPIERWASLLVNKNSFSLHEYSSTRTHRGKTTQRGLVVSDTHYVAYRQSEKGGDGDSRVLPPGRIYVMEAQIITLFDLIARSLHGRTFETHPLHLLALGPRDTMLDARAVSLGTETIRWGARPVVARKLNIVADSHTTFTLWVGPQGQLLRLLEPLGGLRAERDPPAVKRAPRPPPPPKPGG